MKEKMVYSIVSGHQEHTKESPLIHRQVSFVWPCEAVNCPVSTSRGTPVAETVVNMTQL